MLEIFIISAFLFSDKKLVNFKLFGSNNKDSLISETEAIEKLFFKKIIFDHVAEDCK
jgi:hypothetical protein